VVIFDGLDEAADWAAGEDLRFPARLGKNVRLLASARILGRDVGDAGWLERLNWSGMAQTMTLDNLE
jgi:hypothetical protein